MKNFYVKIYPSDMLNGIAGLQPNEMAAYFVILMLIYDEDGPIPFNVNYLSNRCNMRPSTFKRTLESLLEQGKLTLENDFLFNGRAIKELKIRANIRETNSENGRISAKKRQKSDKKSNKTISRNEHNYSISEKKLPEKANKINGEVQRPLESRSTTVQRNVNEPSTKSQPVIVIVNDDDKEDHVRLLLERIKTETDLGENPTLEFGGFFELSKIIEMGFEDEEIVDGVKEVFEKKKTGKISNWKYFTAVFGNKEPQSLADQKSSDDMDAVFKQLEEAAQ